MGGESAAVGALLPDVVVHTPLAVAKDFPCVAQWREGDGGAKAVEVCPRTRFAVLARARGLRMRWDMMVRAQSTQLRQEICDPSLRDSLRRGSGVGGIDCKEKGNGQRKCK